MSQLDDPLPAVTPAGGATGPPRQEVPGHLLIWWVLGNGLVGAAALPCVIWASFGAVIGVIFNGVAFSPLLLLGAAVLIVTIGLVVGSVQAAVLGQRLGPRRRWILATLGGWALGMIIGTAASYRFADVGMEAQMFTWRITDPWSVFLAALLYGAVVGAAVGVGQGNATRDVAPGVGISRWVVASLVGSVAAFGIGMGVTLTGTTELSELGPLSVLGGVLGGVVYGLVTAPVLLQRLRAGAATVVDDLARPATAQAPSRWVLGYRWTAWVVVGALTGHVLWMDMGWVVVGALTRQALSRDAGALLAMVSASFLIPVLVSALAGLTAGVGQRLAAGPLLPPWRSWVPASVASYVVGYLTLRMVVTGVSWLPFDLPGLRIVVTEVAQVPFDRPGPIPIILGYGLFGLVAGVAQGLTLRGKDRQAHWWAAASGLGWAAGGVALSIVAIPWAPLASLSSGLLSGAVYGAITGAVLLWLHRDRQTVEAPPDTAA